MIQSMKTRLTADLNKYVMELSELRQKNLRADLVKALEN